MQASHGNSAVRDVQRQRNLRQCFHNPLFPEHCWGKGVHHGSGCRDIVGHGDMRAAPCLPLHGSGRTRVVAAAGALPFTFVHVHVCSTLERRDGHIAIRARLEAKTPAFTTKDFSPRQVRGGIQASMRK